jgi:hypothetical protein
MTRPLSPAAQAVLDRVAGERDVRWIAAAALRAAADQSAKMNPLGDTAEDIIRGAEREYMRGFYYSIAAELEGQDHV